MDYRLGELRIRQSLVGDLSWESHFGFAEYREGGCFLKGRLLILGEAKGEGIGCLKGEFVDGLKDLPPWTGTEFYCLIEDLVSCLTGRQATEAAVRRWCEPATAQPAAGTRLGDSIERAYRLGRHRVFIEPGGLIRHQTPSDSNYLVTGEAFLVEGILFLSRTETGRTTGPRARFLGELKKLPTWNQTEFYSIASRLKKCTDADAGPPRMGRGSKTLTGSARVTRKVDRLSPIQRLARSFHSYIGGRAGLISILEKIAVIGLRGLKIIVRHAARAWWPWLKRLARRAWKIASRKLRRS